MNALPLLVLCVLTASPTLAPIDQARQQLAASRVSLAKIAQARATHETALRALEPQIVALKAKRQTPWVARELDGLLRRSQQLSDAVGVAAREESASREHVALATARLVRELDAEIVATESHIRALSVGAERQDAQQRWNALRAERQTLQPLKQQAVSPLGAPPAPEDSKAWTARAEALRDTFDKVQVQLAQVGTRVATARRERDLERRLVELGEDEALLDEQDRRLRLLGGVTPSGSLTFSTAGGPAGAETQDDAAGGTAQVVLDARPQIGHLGRSASPDGSLEALLVEENRLATLAATLKRDAEAAERRAHEAP
ncbi:MAG: hypothetical protein ACKVPX_13835 [Myxococcaceae bacterium]